MAGPVRLERDEGLAVATFDSPPLNLFNREMFEALQATIGEVEVDPPRALLFRAEGRAVSGGVDVHEFEGLTPGQGGAALGRADRHGRKGRKPAPASRLRRPRPHPDRRVRARPRLRPDRRRPLGEVRLGREGGRPDAVDGRDPAPRRARRQRSRRPARDERRAVRCRGAGRPLSLPVCSMHRIGAQRAHRNGIGSLRRWSTTTR